MVPLERRENSSVSGNLSYKRRACIESLYSTRMPLPGTQEKEENDRQALEAAVGKTGEKKSKLCGNSLEQKKISV